VRLEAAVRGRAHLLQSDFKLRVELHVAVDKDFVRSTAVRRSGPASTILMTLPPKVGQRSIGGSQPG
jgi:hypothetical protein